MKDVALGSPRDTSSGAAETCAWCRRRLSPGARGDARFCSRRCRQAAFRLRRRSLPAVADAGGAIPSSGAALRYAYADPPYPGLAARYYRHEPTYAGEVDHAKLIASLTAVYDGWALSTSSKSLRDVLPLCPPEARVCAWVKLGGTPPATFGLHSQWEPIIVLQGRRLRPGRRDWLEAYPARGGGSLPGRKPVAFCAWLFDAMGMLPGDTLDDLFPGTGIVGRAWDELSRTPIGVADTSSVDGRQLGRVVEVTVKMQRKPRYRPAGGAK